MSVIFVRMVKFFLKCMVLILVCTLVAQTVSFTFRDRGDAIVLCEKQEKEKESEQENLKEKIHDGAFFELAIVDATSYSIPVNTRLGVYLYNKLPDIPPERI